ncbi:YajQ family cyclic di-GMP-binding protein [Flocculibacter collagenilyticus]|uniref:YajQ family cyclic di-GMP-binding protein n=1 Tax=Flocculibacter collagenilyticus TaxID=2744479 RepID=UPI0018F37C4C|nr:YajQ family cyclic di-GMP-binding protein [Flocculibacter collagenilyticus]
MPSFDIVSEVEMTEVKNAVDNANRELTKRFDFKGVHAEFKLKDGTVQVESESDFQVQQMIEILRATAMKRNIDPTALELKDTAHVGKTFSQEVTFKQGIDQTISKKIVKAVKDSKIKVQVAIQGEKLRVTGKKRDDLQAVMRLVKEGEFGQPFQFDNFRD